MAVIKTRVKEKIKEVEKNDKIEGREKKGREIY